MAFCHKCGYKLEIDDKFCFNCGTPVRESAPASEISNKTAETQKSETKQTVKETRVAKEPKKADKAKGNSKINKKALIISLSVIGVFLIGVLAFAIYNNPTRAMIRRLKFGVGAKPVDFSSTSESDKDNVGTAAFSKGCYVSNYGKYNAEDVSPNKVFNLYHQNGQFYFPEYNQIDKAVKEPGVRYVIYRKDGGEHGSLKNVTLMVFIEFKNKDDAMGYFDKIMDSYFGKNPNDRFERNFINSESINKKLKGTVMGEWTLSDAMSAKTVRLTDLPESNYIRTQNEGRFDYYLNWNFLKWGDIANREPDNAQYIEAYSKRYQGVRAHHLSVKGNQLTLIQSFDLQKNSGEIEDFNRLCNALNTDNLSKLDMDLNLRKYLLCISEIWDPYGTRIDKI